MFRREGLTERDREYMLRTDNLRERETREREIEKERERVVQKVHGHM